VNIEIPEGYEIVSMPENIKAVYNKDIGYYKYVTSYRNGLISTVATFNMDVSVVQPSDYEAFKKFFEAIVSKDAEKIVLKKVD
jgi:ornithine carbamoyltransferase